jgi:hypothetical protein
MLDVVLADGPPAPRGPGRTVNVWRDDEGVPFADATVHAEGYRLEWRGIGVLTFAPGSTRVRLWPSPGVEADAATSAVIHLVQPVILQALGHHTLHASAVRLPAGVVAFCGLSGTGKSTLAFALGRRPGLSQVADDALVLNIAERRITVQALPFRSRLRTESRTFFSRPARSAAVPQASPLAEPLLTVFVLQPVGAEHAPGLTRIGATQAFTALLTHAHCFDESDPAGVASLVQAYLAVADAVPVYRLEYPRDFARLDAVEACVLETVGVQWPNTQPWRTR